MGNKNSIIKSSYIIISVIGIIAGIILAVYSFSLKPVSISETEKYSGILASVNYSKSYRLEFKDGQNYYLDRNAVTGDVSDTLTALEGKKLSLLVDDNAEIMQIKSGADVIISYETAATAIEKSSNEMFFISLLICASGVALIIIGIFEKKNQKKSLEKKQQKQNETAVDGNSAVLRLADQEVKNRVFLQTEAEGYKICYRRVKSTNELVVNGNVYDEYKAIIEFPHTLYATCGGHKIEAGIDSKSFSFIKIDGALVCKKERII